jgi:hypothetical protein
MVMEKENNTRKPTIGCIGMGHMAQRLLDFGYQLTVYDRTKAGIEKELLLDVLGQTAVLTPGQKSKLVTRKAIRMATNPKEAKILRCIKKTFRVDRCRSDYRQKKTATRSQDT